MTRILLAVNDTPAGLAAARIAIRLADETGGPVLAVHVIPDGEPPADDDSRSRASRAVLDYVADLAGRAGVGIETLTRPGVPARVILDQATRWSADVIMLGRSGVRHVGQPFVGSQVLHVLEFADVPVVVVPAA
jgi:nucleotide-binding universal stress UspA family protein